MTTAEHLVDYPPDQIVIAIQYYSEDEHAAMRLARLLADIEPRRRDDVCLAFARRFDCPPSRLLQETFLHCGQKFGVMNLPSQRLQGTGHPHGCNELWSSTMEQLSASWRAGNLRAHSVFTVEPDGCPLSVDWIDRLHVEHARSLRAGKRVSGCLIESPIPHVNGTLMAHLSMWPERLSLHRTPPGQAFDLFHAAVLMQECRPTALIKNVYGATNYSAEVLAALAKETAWLSSTKDDSVVTWAQKTLVQLPSINDDGKQRGLLCAFVGCGREIRCAGFCAGHYTQSNRGASLTQLRPRRVGLIRDRRPFAERFWSKVDKENGPIHPVHGKCWPWTGSTTHNGYGNVQNVPWRHEAASNRAHRVAWELEQGVPPPPDRLVLHRCDNNYVTACRARELPILLASMERHCQPFALHVLAWDWGPPASPPPHTRIVTREEFLARHPTFAPEALPPPARTVINQVCTARWRFLADVIADAGCPVTLIDGDLWFWSSPEPVFDKIGDAPMAVSPHGLAPAAAGLPGVTLESHGKYGAYNSGFTYVASLKAAERLAGLNHEWSHTDFRVMPDGRVFFGDQGYLAMVAEEVGAHVIQHPGGNVGPWNVHTQKLRQAHDGVVFFGGRPLVAYHYSSFRPGVQFADPHYEVTAEQGRILYEPYRAALAAHR